MVTKAGQLERTDKKKGIAALTTDEKLKMYNQFGWIRKASH